MSPEVSRQHLCLTIRKHPVWSPEPCWAWFRDQGSELGEGKEGLQEPGMGCATAHPWD